MNKIYSKDFFKSLFAILILLSVFYYSYQQIEMKKRYNPFTQKLISPNGTITLDDNHHGKLTFLYFGFLSCPDVCPTTLAEISSILKTLSPQQLEKMTFLFVGLDPERDSIERMAKYASHFHEKIIPVTLDPTSLGLFANAFEVSFRKVPLKSTMGYTIDHSTQIVVLSPDRKESHFLLHEETRALKLARINMLLKKYF